MSNQSVAFGVDIGGTSVKMGLFSAQKGLLEKWQLPSRTDGDSAAMLLEIAESLRGCAVANGIHPASILGAGVGAPGPVDDLGVVHGCVNLDWGTVALKDGLEALCGFSIRAENDANAAALGELWRGAAKGYDSMVLLTLGTGVGGAVILNGRLLKGAHGCAGEVGHIGVCSDEATPCSCGNRGCLEQYASATGLVRLAKEAAASVTKTALPLDGLNAERIFVAAQAGDAAALLAVDRMAERLGRGLASIAAVCDPQVFVIGGGLSRAGDMLLDAISHHYRRMAFGGMADTPIKTAALQNDAGIWGAASLILNMQP